MDVLFVAASPLLSALSSGGLIGYPSLPYMALRVFQVYLYLTLCNIEVEIGFMIASSLGIYTTPYVMASEIMPVRHRGIGGSLMIHDMTD
ncbi:unnamed protein product [Leptidea sinapis]|uniref:Uncharacterized protein n=1 Tax=Leptidea sinapis TaxID=189913 RepID=A0A5E4Q0X4_9NEOP|nr:unnamed protein product [Leptidea sinapis]